MANLLTNEIKQKLSRDLTSRKLVVAGLVLGSLFLITIIILSTFWASLFIRNSGSASFSKNMNPELKEVSGGNSTTLLKKVDDQTKILNNYWQEQLISNLVAKALVLKPAGLKVTGVVIERGEVGKIIKLALAGLTDSRTTLVNYVNLLRQDKFFGRVDLPVESLLSDTGGQFVINLEK